MLWQNCNICGLSRIRKMKIESVISNCDLHVQPSKCGITMQALAKCSLLGAVEGGDMVEERRRSALETAKRPVDGKQEVGIEELSSL